MPSNRIPKLPNHRAMYICIYECLQKLATFTRGCDCHCGWLTDAALAELFFGDFYWDRIWGEPTFRSMLLGLMPSWAKAVPSADLGGTIHLFMMRYHRGLSIVADLAELFLVTFVAGTNPKVRRGKTCLH